MIEEGEAGPDLPAVEVQRIAVWYKLGQKSSEEIADHFGHRSLAQVYAALA